MPKQKQSTEAVREPVVIPMTSSMRDIRYLSFQGGGMKGIGDVGVLEVLEEQGILSQIEAVAGSSVGGIMAMLVAIGYTPEEIKQAMLHLDFKALQDKAAPGWIESMHFHQVTPMNVSGGFEKTEDIVKLVLGSSLGLFEGDRLCTVLAQMLAKKGFSPHLNFVELATLAAHPDTPQKNLILTGSNLSDRTTEYYSAETTPDMSIIEAVRISASFPGAFKPVRKIETVIEDGVVKKVEKLRVDGGLLENLPDVFNKPPYYKADQDGVGNPQVLALSFKNTEKPHRKLKTGVGLLKTLYDVVLSEDRLKRKYGSNLVEVDTLGIGVLEFDAPEEKKQQLIDSGRQAVYKTFRTILENEEKDDSAAESFDNYTSVYGPMSIDRLVNLEAALEIDLEAMEQGKTDRSHQHRIQLKLASIRACIFEKAKNPNMPLSQASLEAMQKKAREHFRGIQANQQKDQASLSQEALLKIFHQKKEALETISTAIEKHFDDLHIAKQSLIDYGVHLKEKIAANKNDRKSAKDGKGFYDDLEDILKLQEKSAHYFLEKGISLSNEHHQIHRAAIEKCLKEKMAKYREVSSPLNDSLLAYFFEDLLQQLPHFKIPLDAQMIDEMLHPDIQACDRFIRACEAEMAHNVKKKHVFERQALSLSEKNSKGDQYSALLDFNMALDAHIYRETHFLQKLNNFFISHAPRLAIITQPLFEAVSMVSFIAFLPIAIPARSIARVIGHFSNNETLKMKATKVEHFFRYKSLSHQAQLKVIQKESKKFCELMKKNYEKSDHSETSYLFKLYALYLKQSGIAFEDIVERRSHETLASYKLRVEKLKHQFEILSYGDRAIATIGYEEKASKPELQEGLRAEVMKAMCGIRPDDSEQIEKLQKLGIDPCDLEFFYQIRQKMADGQGLTEDEQLDFMDLAPKFKKQYGGLYREFERVYAENLSLLRPPEKTIMREKLFAKHQDAHTNHGLHYFKQMKDQHKASAHQKMGTHKTPPTASLQTLQTRAHDKHFKPKPHKS